MSAGAWLELIASGLITGGVYALVALGLNLQYGLMRILNIAHGEFLMLGRVRHLGGARHARRLAAGDGAAVVRAPDARRHGRAPAHLPAPDAHLAPTSTSSRRAA